MATAMARHRGIIGVLHRNLSIADQAHQVDPGSAHRRPVQADLPIPGSPSARTPPLEDRRNDQCGQYRVSGPAGGLRRRQRAARHHHQPRLRASPRSAEWASGQSVFRGDESPMLFTGSRPASDRQGGDGAAAPETSANGCPRSTTRPPGRSDHRSSDPRGSPSSPCSASATTLRPPCFRRRRFAVGFFGDAWGAPPPLVEAGVDDLVVDTCQRPRPGLMPEIDRAVSARTRRRCSAQVIGGVHRGPGRYPCAHRRWRGCGQWCRPRSPSCTNPSFQCRQSSRPQITAIHEGE